MAVWRDWLVAGSAPRDAAREPLLATLLPFGVLVLAVVAFVGVQIVGEGERKSLDAFEYHYPFYEWFYRELASGHFPLWNPYQLAGIPTLATLQGGFLYPPHVVYALLPTDTGMLLLAVFHLLLMGGAVMVFARRAGASPIAALLAALLVSLGGAQPGHLANPSMLEAGAWLGVGFLGTLEVALGRHALGAALVAAATGLGLLAGFPQFSVYAAYAWGFLLVALLAPRLRAPRACAQGLGWFVLGVGVGAALAAVQLLPALELADVGGRVRGTLPLSWMLPFGRIGFETPAEGIRNALASRPAVPAIAFTFGWVALLLAPLSLFTRAAGGRRALAFAIFGLGCVTLAFAIGPATPLFDLLLKLPEVGSFRNPWRILFVTDFCLALAAAFGLDVLMSWFARAGAQNMGAHPGSEASPESAQPALPSRAVVAGAVGVAIVLWALLERFVAPAATPLLPYDRSHPHLAVYHAERPVLAALAQQHDRVWTHFLGDMGDVSEKLAAIAGVRSISDNEIMTLARQREYFTYLYWGALSADAHNTKGHRQQVFYGYYNLQAEGIDPAGVAARRRLAQLAAARYWLAPRSAIATPAVRAYLGAAGLRPADVRDPQFIVFEDRDALPRAYVTHALEVAPEPEALLAKLATAAFDPRASSFVEAPLPASVETFREPASRALETAVLRVDTAERVEIDVTLEQPGMLILADSFYPGWKASVDGAAADIHATNHLFRGVALPAGRHHVVFRYAPSSVARGAAISVVGLALFTWLAVRGSRA